MLIETELETTEFCYTDADRQIWEEDLDPFLPQRIFDAHYHLWSDEFLPVDHSAHGVFLHADMPAVERWGGQMFPGRKIDYLILSTPIVGVDVDGHNRFVAQQMQPYKNARMHRLVTPQCTVDDIRRDIEQFGFQGLKPYRTFSTTGDINQCRIHEFLTHEQMALANELGLWVTMHLSKHNGCADEDNLKDLDEFTNRRYPRIKWILAHCARSFTYWAIREAIDRLRVMPNIWYDNSGVCDVMPHYTLFKKEDHRRIFYGSDNMLACAFHGKYVAMGRFWYQIGTPTLCNKQPMHTDARPVLAIYDELLCIKHAAELAELSPSQIEDVFFNNAKDAFGLED